MSCTTTLGDAMSAPTTTAERVAAARAWLGEFLSDDDAAVRLALQAGGEWDELRRFAIGYGPFRESDQQQMLDDLACSVVADADEGRDVFACPYSHGGRHRRAGGATARRHAHADIDGALDLDRVRALGGMAVASGSVADDGQPHGHVYVRLSEDVPAHQHTALCAALGQTVGGSLADPSKVGDSDVLRPAGTLNHKHGQASPVRWLVAPDDTSVRTWAPASLAHLLGIAWPPVESETPERRSDEIRSGQPIAQGSQWLTAGITGVLADLEALPRPWRKGVSHWDPGMVKAARRLVELANALDDIDGARERFMEAAPFDAQWDKRAAKWAAAVEHVGGRCAAVPPSYGGLLDGLSTETTTTQKDDDVTEDARRRPWRDLSELAVSGKMPDRPMPEFLPRADAGLALFYRGRVNRVYGRPENGKTWVALAAGADLLRSGAGCYAHLDLDHMGDEIVRRLALFGVPWAVIGDPERFRLYEPRDRRELADATADLVAWVPDLVTLDSVGELVPLAEAGSNNPDELTAVNRLYVQPIADAGAGVILLDHMAKYAGAGDGPTGTDAKTRTIRGASYHASVAREFSPGHGGAVRLALQKDTVGSVRAVLATERARKVAGMPVAGDFELMPIGDDADAQGSLAYQFTSSGPDEGASADTRQAVEDARQSLLMARICEVLAASQHDPTKALSQRAVSDQLRARGVKHTATDSRVALEVLVAAGHITARPHRLLRPHYFIVTDGSEASK